MTDTTDTVRASEALKPCPFCGSDNVAVIAPLGAGNVRAIGCFAKPCAVEGPWGKDEHQAREVWNTRATPTSPTGALVEALRRIADETQRQQLPITALVHEIATAALASIGEAQSDEPVPATKAGEVETWESIAAWCEETFGPITLARTAERANEEMQELLAEPDNVIEAADVCIVLSRYPGLWDAVQRKMAINRARTWDVCGDGTGYHIPAPALATQPATSQEGEAQSADAGQLAKLVTGIALVIRDFPDNKSWGSPDQAEYAAGILDRASAALASSSPAQSDGEGS